MELPGQGGGEVEAEAVDVHLGDPVAQRVHDQLEYVRAAHQQAVAGAGGVLVEALVPGEAVVGDVVQAAHGERRAQVVALGGVVVDHVEDDLDAGRVQRLHHRLELLHLLAPVAGGGVGGVRGEEADGVVAPVVGQAEVPQPVVADELVHRHQFDRGDAELGEVLDHGRVGDARVGAADLLGDPGVQFGQALHMGLVEHRAVVVGAGRPVGAPVEVRVDHHRVHGVGGRVEVVAALGGAEVVAVDRLVPVDVPAHRLGVRVQQQLGAVVPLAEPRVVGAVDAESVALARLDAREVGVPDEGVRLAQFDGGLRTVLVEQAELDPVGALREHGEVGAGPVVGGTEGVGGPWPDLHGSSTSLRRRRTDVESDGRARTSEALSSRPCGRACAARAP